MAPKSPSLYSPSSSKSPLPRQNHHFPSIQERITEEGDLYDRYWFHYATTPRRSSGDIMEKEAGNTPNHPRRHHPPTPPHKHPTTTRAGSKDASISIPCDNCRPNPQEKISIVPSEYHLSRLSPMPSPNRFLRTIISPFLTRKSPVGPHQIINDDQQYWKASLGELANKLIETTRSRDEALVEASRLKHSMTELEKKLNRLEVYCHGLKSGLEKQTGNGSPSGSSQHVSRTDGRLIEQHFLTYVSEARNNVRVLSRLLGSQLPRMGLSVHEAIFAFLRSYGMEISLGTTNPKNMVLYLESLLNHSFFENFETVGFGKDAATSTILNPTERCRANFDMFKALKGMTWQEVGDKGAKHFSERFGQFYDRKMNEIRQMLKWRSAWSEQLLEGFFCASKSVWLVHLLANSVHPGISIFRVAEGAGFDPVYMEQATSSGRNARVRTAKVQVMVAPGFYVHNNMVKCKVLCCYILGQSEIMNIDDNVAQ